MIGTPATTNGIGLPERGGGGTGVYVACGGCVGNGVNVGITVYVGGGGIGVYVGCTCWIY